MEFYLAIFKLELSYLAKIKPEIKKLKGETILKRIEEGAPLLDISNLIIQPRLFKNLLEAISQIIWEQNPDFKENLQSLLIHPDLNSENRKELPLFINQALTFNTSYLTELATSLDLDVQLLFFITHHCLTPFVEKVSYLYRDSFDYTLWQRETCPFCSKKPAMAMYREDEKKILQCYLCRSWWTYPSPKCVVCGNEDTNKLEYFYLENDEAHLAEVCNHCKKYIKTTDCRKLSRTVDLEIEDIATIHLDIVAKERGYAPAGRIIFATRLE